MNDRNIEIWSTRLQREILALESSDDESKKIELLPPFISTLGHTLNIEGGIAKVEFRIDVEKGEIASNAAAADVAATAGEGDKDGKTITDQGSEETQETENTDAAGSKEETKPDTEATNEGGDNFVVLVLDASLYWKDNSANDSNAPMCYPFQKPLAIIKSGASLLSEESTISDGDEVVIDLDWTPSIHLSDAVTNVALKIRECVKRGEPLHAAITEGGFEDGGALTESLMREARQASESILETKKAVGAMFSSGLSSLSAKGSSFASKGQSMKGMFSSALGENLSAFSGQKDDDANNNEVGQEEVGQEEETEAPAPPKEIPDIGDEIDLSEEPWNLCVGMYSCKALKRPAFVEASIAEASSKQKKDGDGASSGFAAKSMFGRFAKSAKSVMEESFLMITDKCILEFKANRLNIGSGTVTFAIGIDQMAKLKFRREESLSLFFKVANDDPLVYMCLDSALAVKDIQNVLKQKGVKGKHTNAATQRAIQMALNLVALIQEKEKELLDQPTVDRVNEIMDLYRQAAEKFESAGDPRHEEVMAHMKRFLNQKFTTSILDGTFHRKDDVVTKPPVSPVQEERVNVPVPQGEVLEQCKHLSNDDYDDDDDDDHLNVSGNDAEDEMVGSMNDTTLENMEDMLAEAVKDMGDLGMEDDHINEILSSPPPKQTASDDHDDTFAELDAMLNDADKELNELLNS
uniref:Uncharacterized protein n=2 Tax=Skeletonema marinoi TaxID=267567 RepID=A0A7S2LQS3_9STRA|mmetsp:Transcript_27886/g.47174  ORF Transcript_27886/g.47174 Transcript_27886/m.47174 type:complete len:694 (+) Transcript_27886:130-2211(+)